MSRPQLRGRAARLARLLPTAGPASAARTPFVLLVVVLLGGGLIVLLMLNSSLNEGSFRLSKLKRETTELTEKQQELQREVDGYENPDWLQRRAGELGMVPGGSPAFLNPAGKIHGAPTAAQAPAPPPEPKPEPEPSTSAPDEASPEKDTPEPQPSGTASSATTSAARPEATQDPSPAPSTSAR